MTPSATSIPGYVLGDLIGRGGMGAVYEALQLSHDRRVAIKLLAESLREDPDFVERFAQEARLLATLEHPHIVPMLDSGEADGVPYIVMRLIDGPNLRDVIRLGTRSEWEVIALLEDVAEALDFAHAHGVLHRDIKPHNMLLDHGAHVWLADFGLTTPAVDAGHLASVDELAGTCDYLAPELLVGHPASVASDIYALAVTAFQLLTGQLPFARERDGGVLRAHTGTPRPAASALNDALPAAVDSVLADGMAVDPSARPTSATAFVNGLADALEVTGQTRRAERISLPHFAHARVSVGQARVSVPTEESSADTGAETRGAFPATGGGSRRSLALVGVCLVVVICAVISGVVLVAGSHRARAATLDFRTAGAPARTWFDYGSGVAGASLPAHTRVRISCRVASPAAGSDPVWWYRVASEPWDQQFYARASGFDPPASTTGAGGSRRSYDPAVPVCSYFPEIPGNQVTPTWINPRTAGNGEGMSLPGFTPAHVLCRVKGFEVQDTDVWWYRIGGSPWNGRYYATADAFYNNGAKSGTLRGSSFVDMKVPMCNADESSSTQR